MILLSSYKGDKMIVYSVFGAGIELRAVEITRTHPLKSHAEVSEPLALFCPLWDRERTMSAFQAKPDWTTPNCHTPIIGGKGSEMKAERFYEELKNLEIWPERYGLLPPFRLLFVPV